MAECYHTLSVCMARVAKLDSDGTFLPGTKNLYVTDSIISVTMAIQLKAGAQHEQPNGCGALCFSYDEPDVIKGLNLQSAWCQEDPELSNLLFPGTLITDGMSDNTGWAAPYVGSAVDSDGVSLEIWTLNIQGSDVDDDYPYVRWVFGKTTWVPADKTFANGPIVHPWTGKAKENSNWDDGPVGDWDFTSDRLWQYNGDTDPPTSQCGAQAIAS